MTREDLQRKTYIGLLRCSSAGQIDTSIDDQRRLLDAFARDHGMVCADYVSLEGVSGSLPGNRSDIDQIIQRKETQDDFEILLIQDTSRFTRGGIQHAHKLESELNAAGIEVVFASGSIPDGEIGDLVKSVHSYADQLHAKSISFASARGSMSSILDGRSPYCRKPPYGIDRLYIAPEGTPNHIIRNLPNGTQLKLHPETKEEVGRFGVNEKTGVPNHYIKQKQERIVLVPGDERCVEIIRQMFRRRFVDNWGAYRIATELNTNGIPSPTGRAWNTTTVNQILRNPIYLGQGIANRYSQAVYHMRSENHPEQVRVDKRELYRLKRPAKRTRPGSDWHYQEYVHLASLLDDEVKDLAHAKQQFQLEAQATVHHPKPNRDRHRDSTFFLKGILRSKQGDHLMTGTTTGKKTGKKRYYRVSRAYVCPDGNKTLRRMIPADPLEQALLETVKSVLLSLPDLRERIEKQVRAAAKTSSIDGGRRDELVAERDSIRNKLEIVLDEFDPSMKDLAQRKIAELRAQLKSVEARLARCKSAAPLSEQDVQARVDETTSTLRNLGKLLGDAPPATLNRFLQVFISKLVVDLETREVEIEIALPAHLDAGSIEMCLVEGFACKTSNEAHQDAPAALVVYGLIWDHHKRVYYCRNAA